MRARTWDYDAGAYLFKALFSTLSVPLIAGSMMSGLKWYEMEMTFVRGLLPQSVMPVEVGQIMSTRVCRCGYIAGFTLVADSGH